MASEPVPGGESAFHKPDGSERRFLVVGNSHVTAFFRAAESRRQSGDPTQIHAVHVRSEKYRPELQVDDGKPRLGDRLVADLTQMKEGGALLVSCVGGNRHNVLGLMQHSRPFDFVLAEAPDLPLQKGFEVVPTALLESLLRELARKEMLMLSALKELDPGVIHLESPPPVRDSGFILANAGVYFHERGIESIGVTPHWVRYKLWRLYSGITRAVCGELGITFIENPEGIVDPEGFLLPCAIQDATHANAWYAEKVISGIESRYRDRQI
ncbi:MAG TPA: hypothetical protein VGD21_04880 [Lysobacter sp.]